MVRYHLRKSEREITDKDYILKILQNGKFTTIAMCRDNEPYLVTMSYGYDQENHRLYFHASNKGLKLDFISENPQVCGTIIEDHGYIQDQCEHQYRTVVFWGRMFEVESLEEKKYGLDILLNHLEEDPKPIKKRNVKDDNSYQKVAILRLDIDEISGKQAIKK